MISSHRARWRSYLESRLEVRGDDRGVALLTALMFMVMATGLSLVLLSAILSQAVPAYTAQKNTRTVYAAQAGLQSALAVIRSADAPADSAGHIFGAPKELPCSLSGRVAADGTGATYAVTVEYFIVDPTEMTASDRASNAKPCSSSNGLGTIVPRYAYVVSKGQDVAIPGTASAAVGNRTLSAVYSFKITNVNVAGGLIFSGNSYCLEADSAADNSRVKFVPKAQCTKTPLQLWTYTADYQLKLASSGTPGVCITGPSSSNGGTQDARLRTCKSKTDSARWNQLWSWTGDYTWQGQNSSNTGASNYYLSPGSISNGSYLRVSNGRSGSFSPSLEIGAGAASYGTHQLVNYREFGRCADVTNGQIGYSYMISYPCKQDPTGTGNNLDWNHKWYYTEPDLPATTSAVQFIYVIDGSGNYKCLTAPASGGIELTFQNCVQNVRQYWTRTNDTGNYAGSYLVINQGKCLFADTSALHTDGTSSRLRLTSCNGSLAQKWNAPPTATESTVGGYSEVAG
ncbi:hypothetical protein B7495_14565 [Cryobacterium sp. LW097]|uniref:hypothetical protein n=1 Tax=Cryobacterium sp. LW097 TaxID=1978566 RepID=UPI000B4CADCE|nr:hypothetical protein [Cryobacterium sp. LW097]ASD23181.1 hypothetical protein B7495_14565 [Cryobacterium sp. LW097]